MERQRLPPALGLIGLFQRTVSFQFHAHSHTLGAYQMSDVPSFVPICRDLLSQWRSPLLRCRALPSFVENRPLFLIPTCVDITEGRRKLQRLRDSTYTFLVLDVTLTSSFSAGNLSYHYSRAFFRRIIFAAHIDLKVLCRNSNRL